MSYEKQYRQLVSAVLDDGSFRETRNADTLSTFATRIVINELVKGQFPVLQGRHIYTKGILGELAAMLRGPKHISDFTVFDCNYWKQWADEDTGDIRIDYGNVWLDFNGYNQLKELVKSLKNDPTSRRHLVTGWKPDNFATSSLPCCHMLYQWYVTEDGYLEMQWYQRSVDVMVGLPSDAAFAAAWNIALAHECNLKPGKITMIFGDTHIYDGHVENACQYLQSAFARKDLGAPYYAHTPAVPEDHTKFLPSDISILDYSGAPKISFEVVA